jgi:hypothetical protein
LLVFLFKEIAVSISRAEYFKDLVGDCEIAVQEFPVKDQSAIIAALIISDSINGLRKALLQYRSYSYDKD